jgi:hypothetical protein
MPTVEEHPEQVLAKQGILIKGKRRNDHSAYLKSELFKYQLSISIRIKEISQQEAWLWKW